MYCCKRKGQQQTREVILAFHRKQLLYDIKNYAYIEGHIWGEDAQHAQHTLVDIGEEGNVDRVNRILSTVHSAVEEMLYPYTKEEIGEEEYICNGLQAPPTYYIIMNVPTTMSLTTLKYLNKQIHEYMVCRVIYDWLSITHPEKAEVWYTKVKDAEEEINSIKNHRTGVFTRPPHPF